MVGLPERRLEGRELQRSPTVQVLVAVWLGVALLQATVVSSDDMAMWLGFHPVHWTKAWWTVLSYAAIQDGLPLLAINTCTLLAFGPRLERAWGSKTFLFFFLWCVAGGAIWPLTLFPTGPTHGTFAGVL